MASDIQLQILADDYKHDNKTLQVIWKCGQQTKEQICSIRKYIEPDANKALGFHTLFTKKHVEKCKFLFKVTCIIISSKAYNNNDEEKLTQSNRSCNNNNNNNKNQNKNKLNKNNNNNKNIRKRHRLQTILDCVDFGKANNHVKRHKSNVNNNNKNNHYKKNVIQSRPFRNFFIRDDYRLPSAQLDEIVKIIGAKLELTELFDIIPNIDCFSSHANYQRICKYHITKTDDFFSNRYEDINYWKDKVVWCFPPYVRKTIVDCINSFPRRMIKGYVCVPYERKSDLKYIGDSQRLCKEYIIMKGRDSRQDLYVADRSEIQRSGYDMIIFYFDYSKKLTKTRDNNNNNNNKH